MSRLRRDRPGYTWRRRADGSIVHYWSPNRASKKAPAGLPTRPIADGADDATIVQLCRNWTDELLADLEMLGAAPAYDGTISSLIRLYRTAKESPYHALKHSTRIRDYEPSLKLIDRTVGKRQLAALKGADFRRWFEEWGKGGLARRAHGAIRKLRVLFSYGTQERLAHCSGVREILSLMEFDAPATRRIKMDHAQARAICDEALKAGRASIALTQALQWDTALRRIHIIGEWLPAKAGDTGGIIRGRTKWQGLTAADIVDEVLTVQATSRHKAATRHDLKLCPLVRHVLARMERPKIGPLIVAETTGLPWRENYYATEWRAIAKAAGVPAEVWSMDSRAGAISEAEAATNVESARKMAGHTNVKTTLGYVRNDDLDNNRRVARARARKRK